MGRRRRNREPSRQTAPEHASSSAAQARPPTRLLPRAIVFLVLLMLIGGVALWYRPKPDVERLLAETRLALERGETTRAEQLLEQILARDENHGMALMYRGQLALERGDWQQALRNFQRVPRQPEQVRGTASFLEASVRLQQGQARAAEAVLLEAIRLNPEYLQAHERHLQLCVLQLRRDATLERLAAIQQFRRLTLHEMSLQLLAGDQVIDAKSAVETLRGFLAEDPDDVASRVALARYLNSEKRGTEAVKLLRDFLAQHPAEPRVRGLLVELLVEQERLEAAAKAAEPLSLEAIAPLEAWRGAAKLAQARGDVKQAAGYYGHVVRLAPEDFTSRYQWGLALQRSGSPEAGKRELERSVQYDRLQHQVLSATRIDQGRPDLLLPLVVEAARLLRKLERYEQAVAWYEIVAAIDPRHPAANSELAAARMELRTAIARRAEHTSNAAKGVSPSSVTPAASAEHDRDAGGAEPEVTPSDEAAVIRLRDVHEQVGIDFQYFNGASGFKYLIESMGGGVAVLDYDADGWPDVYFPQGAPFPLDQPNDTYTDRLFRNRGDGTFVNVTQQAGLHEVGYSQGCTAGDIDNDGFVDLVVANYGRNTLYMNNGDGTFRDATASSGAIAPQMSSSVALADLDRDGDLDLYVANYVDSLKVCRDPSGRISTCHPSNFSAEQDRLYLNHGDGTFEDVTESSGIVAPDGKGLGIVIADLDDDQWPDIYVANDSTPNFLFRNLGASQSEMGGADALRFREEGLISGTAVSGEGRAEAGMGIACGDLNGDGRLDLLTTNYYLETCTLYVNQGDGYFADETRAAGLYGPTEHTLGFGTQAVDLDLDGDLELFLANGHIDEFEGSPWKMPPQLFLNQGRARFTEISGASGPYFDQKLLGRGVARWDWNRDGQPDLIVVHQDAPAAVLNNETVQPGHYAVVELHGVVSNRDAIGARLTVQAGGRTQVVEVCGGDGFYASNERRQYLGLGAATHIDRLEVRWPSGTRQVFENVPADRMLVLTEGASWRDVDMPGDRDRMGAGE